MNHQNTKIAVSLAFTLFLHACGGGGGSSSPPTSGSTGQSSVVTSPSAGTNTVSIVTTAATAPSSYNAEELATFNRFNLARSTCGFGYLAHNDALASSSSNHIGWMVKNNTVSHSEISGTPGFTGSTSSARMTAAGYLDQLQSGEVLTGGTNVPKTGFGLLGARALLGAPYHLQGLMQGNRQIGIALRSGGTTGSGADIISAGALNVTWLVSNMAASTTMRPQAQQSADVLTYPCQGVTDTVTKIENESPNPIPSRDLAANPIGHPIFVQTLSGQPLVIMSASVTGPSGTVQLLPTMTSANDPNSNLQSNQAFLIPNLPLSASPQYTVQISGTNGGSGFSKSFTFTTGS